MPSGSGANAECWSPEGLLRATTTPSPSRRASHSRSSSPTTIRMSGCGSAVTVTGKSARCRQVVLAASQTKRLVRRAWLTYGRVPDEATTSTEPVHATTGRTKSRSSTRTPVSTHGPSADSSPQIVSAPSPVAVEDRPPPARREPGARLVQIRQRCVVGPVRTRERRCPAVSSGSGSASDGGGAVDLARRPGGDRVRVQRPVDAVAGPEEGEQGDGRERRPRPPVGRCANAARLMLLAGAPWTQRSGRGSTGRAPGSCARCSGCPAAGAG